MAVRMTQAGLVAATVVSALVCYTVSVKVSGQRAEVTSLKRQIAGDLKEIRQLEAELRTRASLPQLQQWNDEVLALVPARANQYLASPVHLARFEVPTAPEAPERGLLLAAAPAAPATSTPAAAVRVTFAPQPPAVAPAIVRTAAPAAGLLSDGFVREVEAVAVAERSRLGKVALQ